MSEVAEEMTVQRPAKRRRVLPTTITHTQTIHPEALAVTCSQLTRNKRCPLSVVPAHALRWILEMLYWPTSDEVKHRYFEEGDEYKRRPRSILNVHDPCMGDILYAEWSPYVGPYIVTGILEKCPRTKAVTRVVAARCYSNCPFDIAPRDVIAKHKVLGSVLCLVATPKGWVCQNPDTLSRFDEALVHWGSHVNSFFDPLKYETDGKTSSPLFGMYSFTKYVDLQTQSLRRLYIKRSGR